MECLSTTLKEDYLTCMICLELYSEPQTLRCLHTFCKLCLQKFVNTSGCKGPYKCPVCDETFSVDGKDVKLNFHLQSMTDLVKHSKDFPQMPCSYCSLLQKNEVAVSRCVTCLDYLCETCTKTRHTFTRQTRNHEIVSLSDIKSGMYDSKIRSNQRTNCPKHVNEILRMHCIQCDHCVCVECIILDHKNHDLQSFSVARKAKEMKIQTTLEIVKKKNEKMIQNKNILSEYIKNVSDKKKTLQDQINRTFTDVLRRIHEIERRAKKELDDAMDSKQEIAQHSIDDYSELCKSIVTFRQISENVLTSGDDMEVLSLYGDIKKNFFNLKKEWELKESQHSEVKMADLKITWNESEMKIIFETNPIATVLDKKKTTPMHETVTETADSNVATQKKSESSASQQVNPKSTLLPKVAAYETTDSNVTTQKKSPCPESSAGQQVNPKSTLLPKVAAYKKNLIETLYLKEASDHSKPVFSNVAWINKEKIAVVDTENEKIKILNLTNRLCTSHKMPGVLTVSSYELGIACRSINFCMKVFNITFTEIKSRNVPNVSCVVSSVPNNPILRWMTKWKIYSYTKRGVSQIPLYNIEKKPFVLGTPKHAFCCLNGSYIVSDKKDDCVYFIGSDGIVTMQIDHYPGSISQNNNEDIFITDYENGTISVFDYTGKWHSELKIGTWRSSPRSIAIHDDKLLVATKYKILLFQLKQKL